MTIVNTKEFDFDMALRNDVIVQKGDNMFIVQKLANDEPDIICEPDDDFYRSISGEEFKKRALEIVEKVHNRYYSKK